MPEPSAPVAHPLEPLQADEIRTAVAAVWESGRLVEGALFSTVTLDEPSKEVVLGHRPGDPVQRRVQLLIVPGPESSVIEAVVELPEGKVVGWTEHEGMRPALLFDDAYRATIALRESPEWQAAMERRGITDFEKVQIDPWPTGNFGNPIEDGRRITRCLSYYREDPSDNGYARPIEGVIATVDGARGEVLEVLDLGVVPLPEGRGNYRPEDVQPSGPICVRSRSSSRTGSASPSTATCSSWQRWSLRVSMDPLEGLVLHTDRLRRRRRRSPTRSSTGPRSARWSSPTVTRVPFTAGRTPSTSASGVSAGWPTHWRSGCDCLGEITYLDADLLPASTATPTWWRTPSASTRRTTGSSGSTTT